jgi:hypothetical protein
MVLFRLGAFQWVQSSLALIVWMGDEMDENLAIPKAVLDKIRGLSDENLVKLIWLISDYSWPRASMELPGLVEAEKEKTK